MKWIPINLGVVALDKFEQNVRKQERDITKDAIAKLVEGWLAIYSTNQEFQALESAQQFARLTKSLDQLIRVYGKVTK